MGDEHASGLRPVCRRKPALQDFQAIVDSMMRSLDQRADLLGGEAATGPAKDGPVQGRQRVQDAGNLDGITGHTVSLTHATPVPLLWRITVHPIRHMRTKRKTGRGFPRPVQASRL